MKNKSLLSLAFAGLVVSSTASAQIAIRNFTINGSQTNVVATAMATVDAAANTYTLQVSNLTSGVGGALGTITALGFNVPFSNVALGSNGSNLSLLTTFNISNVGGHTGWSIIEPFNLNAGGQIGVQEAGAEADNNGNPNGNNPQNGIHFGEVATFVFTFNGLALDFTDPDLFFGQGNNLTLRWQEVVNGAQDSDVGVGPGTPPGVGEESPVPEPSTYGMMAAACLLGLVGWRRLKVLRAPA